MDIGSKKEGYAMKSTNHEIIPATQEEAMSIDDKIAEFNRSQVPVTQERTGGLKNSKYHHQKGWYDSRVL